MAFHIECQRRLLCEGVALFRRNVKDRFDDPEHSDGLVGRLLRSTDRQAFDDAIALFLPGTMFLLRRRSAIAHSLLEAEARTIITSAIMSVGQGRIHTDRDLVRRVLHDIRARGAELPLGIKEKTSGDRANKTGRASSSNSFAQEIINRNRG